jgi:predicted dehydrogenase
MPVKWGVIGCGGIADRRTIPEGFMRSSLAELVAVQDVAEDRAKAVGAKYGVAKVYLSETDLVADPSVEAVYIASPNHLHHAHTLLAARAGKHVLCEKPLSPTVAQAEEMVVACRDAGVKLGMNFMMRFHACHERIRSMIAAGEMGTPVLGKAELTCWYPPIPGAFRQDPEKSGGGALADMGNHCIDLLEFLFGQRVKRVSGFMERLVQDYPVEDTAAVLLEFDGGAVGMVNALFNVPDAAAKNMLVIYGSKGSAWTFGTIGQDSGGQIHAVVEREDRGYDADQVRMEAAGEEVIVPEPVNMYQAFVDGFSKAVAEDGQPPVTAEEGLWSQRVLEACYLAARTGQTVEL